MRNNLEKATKLINGLSKERKKWNKTVNQIDKEFDYLPGDCALSAAFITYMGPFGLKCRELLMNLWVKFTKEKVPNNPNFDITLFLTDPKTIRNWNSHGLSNDRFSIENGIVISNSNRFPLILDPQCQACRWIKNIESENKLKIIDNRLFDYMQNLEIALQNGYPTLMQIDYENLDPFILSILAKSIVKTSKFIQFIFNFNRYLFIILQYMFFFVQGNKLFIQMGKKLLPYNENFRIFITTKVKNTNFSSTLLTRTTIVNFTIEEECLEEQLLKTLVNVENPGLEELKDNTIFNIEKNKKALIEMENDILKMLDESECSLLENEQLLLTLESSKSTFSEIKEQIQSSLATQAEIYIAREV